MNLEGYFHPETDNYRYWTSQEEDKLKELVLTSKFSFKDIGKILERTGQSCQDHSIIMGLNNEYIYRKYSFDKDYWSTPNLINSYYSGFSAADASIKNKGSRYLLEIQKLDIGWLEEFKRYIKFNGPILKRNRIDKNSSTISICINSEKWKNDLATNFSIIPNKTYRLEPPRNLDKYLLFSWLIGYTCGDGTIHLNKITNQIQINYVSSSEYIIKWIQNFIDLNFQGCYIRKTTNNCFKNRKWNCWHYNLSGIKAAIIIDYLRQFPVPKLDRKWNNPRVLQKIDEYKLKYSHLFKTLNQSEIMPFLPNTEIN